MNTMPSINHSFFYCYLFLTLSLVSCKSEQELTLQIMPATVPSSENSMFPNLTTTAAGQLIMSWIHEPDTVTFLKIASYQNDKWSDPKTVATGNDWFVNWADFPAIHTQPDGTILTNYLPKNSDKTYGYDVAIQQSIDGGKNWLSAITPHRDSTETEHGFVSFFNNGKDQTGIIWLDGRKTASVAGEEQGHNHGHGHGEEKDMTLRFANLNTAGEITNATEIDPRVCSCCQTDAANFEDGAIVVYRDRSAEEIRDISYLLYQNGKWSEPKLVHADNWKIAACPVNGPAVAAANQQIAIAWFTSSEQTPKVLLALSEKINNGFQSPIQIDNGEPLGRVDVQFLNDNELIVSWLENKAEQTFLKIKRVDVNGNIIEEQVVNPYNSSRASGFPRMASLSDGRVFLAWTEVGGGETIRMVELSYYE